VVNNNDLMAPLDMRRLNNLQADIRLS